MESSRLRQVHKLARDAGVEIASIEQRRKHMCITLANGRKVFGALTPSDRRADLNLLASIKHEANYKPNKQ